MCEVFEEGVVLVRASISDKKQTKTEATMTREEGNKNVAAP